MIGESGLETIMESKCTNIEFIGFKPMTEERLKEVLDWDTGKFSRKRLNEVLKELQVIAGYNKLPVPIKWMYLADKQQEVETKGFFGKVTKETLIEYTIYLHFDTELSEEEYRMWWLTVKGIQISLQSFIPKG